MHPSQHTTRPFHRSTLLATGLLLGLWLTHSPAIQAQPANDALADAVPITALPFANTQDTTGQTADGPESCIGFPPNVWYTLTLPTETIVFLQTEDSNYNTFIDVYVVQPDDSFSHITCGNPNLASLNLSRFVAA